MDKKVFEQEEKNLASTLDKVIKAKDVLENKLEGIGRENLGKLKDLRETPETSGLDFFMFLDQMHQDNLSFNLKDKFHRLEELGYLEKDPYFARIDLEDSTSREVKNVYIGKFGYTEKIPVITDWRAKIASVYYRYRYPQKDVKYQTPDGEISSDLNLKRTFEIDKGSIVKYYNNDLQLDESEIIAEKIEQRTGGVLEDIVETIQESQLDIIEADPRNICVVQGCVGSGKSTVAIHKLSHIFFNYPTLISPRNSLLVAKSQVLIGYLSTLFPKLGIFDINYKTLKELIINILFREELTQNIDLDDDTIEFFTKKDVEKLEYEVQMVHKELDKKIETLFQKEEFKSFKSYKYSERMTPFENITEIIVDLEEELSMQQEEVKENPKSIRALLHKENVKVLKKMITSLKKYRLDLKNSYFKKALKNLGIKPGSKLNYKDILIFLYIHLELVGLQKYKKFEYCVVDEGQDFNLLEYLILKKLVLFGRLCVLGDLNQGYTNEGLSNWDDLTASIIKDRKTDFYTLDTNYRSTKPIINLANTILKPFSEKYLPKSINRAGSKPKIVEFDNGEKMLSSLKSELVTDVKNLNKSVGIICYNENDFNNVQNIVNDLEIEKGRIIELQENKRISYIPKGVYYTMFNNCKGLEFSKVYVLGLNPKNIENENEAKKAFVSVTRAMNELHVYYVK